MIQAFIALGSNLQNPTVQVKTAIIELAEIPETQLLKTSSLYLNPPIGVINQPDFINAVTQIITKLPAETLLQELFKIERLHGRLRAQPNGPRTLDLDLLLYGDENINTPILKIPHPALKERDFVIYPLIEIAPELLLPCGLPIYKLLEKFPNPNFKRVT